MTEREILKKLVESDDLLEMKELFVEARKLLASDPPPEHPAISAYRKWHATEGLRRYTTSQGFLEGWKRALEWAAGQRRGLVHAQDFAVDLSAYAHATPEHLP